LRETRFIGVATNNQAEYHAVLAALKTAATLKPETVTCYSDSELVVKQLRGEYAVKNSVLKHLWKDVQDFKKGFREVQFVHVPRSHSMIAEADSLVNRALDAQQNIR
jgi:ribonuclease HI